METFQQYEERQRRERAAREQQLVEEQARKKQESEALQAVREQERRATEQRLVEQQQLERLKAAEAQRLKDEIRNEVLGQIAKSLQAANQQAREAQQAAHLKRLEEQHARAKVWIGWDGKVFESPREQKFWNAWKAAGYWDEIPLICGSRSQQHHIGRFRLDFADLGSKSAIEVNGWGYHHDRKTYNKDHEKVRYLKKQGWEVLSFTGDDIQDDVEGCVLAAYEFICERQGKAG